MSGMKNESAAVKRLRVAVNNLDMPWWFDEAVEEVVCAAAAICDEYERAGNVADDLVAMQIAKSIKASILSVIDSEPQDDVRKPPEGGGE